MREKPDSTLHHLSVESILLFQKDYLAQLRAAYRSLEGLGRFKELQALQGFDLVNLVVL